LRRELAERMSEHALVRPNPGIRNLFPKTPNSRSECRIPKPSIRIPNPEFRIVRPLLLTALNIEPCTLNPEPQCFLHILLPLCCFFDSKSLSPCKIGNIFQLLPEKRHVCHFNCLDGQILCNALSFNNCLSHRFETRNSRPATSSSVHQNKYYPAPLMSKWFNYLPIVTPARPSPNPHGKAKSTNFRTHIHLDRELFWGGQSG